MTRRPAKGISAVAFMAGFSSGGRVHRELDAPNESSKPRAIENGATSTAFADCELCGESLSVSGHDDQDCPRCYQASCSAFGCWLCNLLEDVDR